MPYEQSSSNLNPNLKTSLSRNAEVSFSPKLKREIDQDLLGLHHIKRLKYRPHEYSLNRIYPDARELVLPAGETI